MSEDQKRKVEPFVGREDAVEAERKRVPNPEKVKPDDYPLVKALNRLADVFEAGFAQLAHQLCRLADNKESIVPLKKEAPVPTPKAKSPEAPTAPAVPTPPTDRLGEIKASFSQELENMLKFEDMGDYIEIAPRRFLGSDNFAKIASIVRNLGGEYISAGKESHFKVAKAK